MGSDVGQIFPTASLHRDHSISYALVCEKEISHMGKNNGHPDLVCENFLSHPHTHEGFLYSCLHTTWQRCDKLSTTVVPTNSDSDVMFCLQSYHVLIIDRSLVY